MISFGYYYFSLNVRQKLFTDEDDRIHSVIGIPFKYDSDELPEQTNGCTPTTVPYVETIAVQDDNVGVMAKAIAWLVNHTVANCFDVMAEQKCV